MEHDKKTLVSVRHLCKWFPIKKWFFEKKEYVKAVDDISFDLYEGETLGIAGESGCGKSTLLRAVLRIVEQTRGEITYNGEDFGALRGESLQKVRCNMQIVFQDPYSALDGYWKVGSIIEEPLIINRTYATKEERRTRVLELMEQVGLDASYVDRYPHEFSGGQRQRIVIARALATNPKLLVCDEAVSALDVSVRAQILNLLEDLQRKLKLTYMFISHDLSVIEHISDRVAIMYLGKIVEMGSKSEIFENPKHPYTRALLSAIPKLGCEGRNGKRLLLEGDIPSPVNPPSGCRFHTRCEFATERCKTQTPSLEDVGREHHVACFLCHDKGCSE